ncbi:dethiobiotin synthase [Brevibacillus migulae]|uniref:dethiobiotin synthase n=1 Tax=Brevibacillus migulae TaxID=1644114 RepID=UPI00106EB219|nr:dethiobiotin synthase [Brevibacillus migulae]
MAGKGLFITGTGTGVGKTAVTAYLTALCRDIGIKAAAYKPIQSGAVLVEGQLLSPDVMVYQSVAGKTSERSELCTYCLAEEASPHLAARRAGVTIQPEAIQRTFDKLTSEYDIVLVEGAGGLAVPLAAQAGHYWMTADLVRQLALPLLIVTSPHLGTINHTLLTIQYAKAQQLPVFGMIVNGLSEEPTLVEADNLSVLEQLGQLPILGIVPQFSEPITAALTCALQRKKAYIDVKRLMELIAPTKEMI